MKKIILVLVVMGFSFAIFAQQGTIVLKSALNQKFWLFIDDVLQNQYSTTSIQIVGLQCKSYRVRVEMDNPVNFTFGQLLTINRNPTDNNYLLGETSFTKTRTMIRPLAVLNFIVPNYNYSNYYQQYLYPGFGTPDNYWKNDKGNTYHGYHPQHSGNSNYNQGGYNDGHHQGGQPHQPPYGGETHGHGVPCMPQRDFNQLYNVIQKESFENTKLTIAKQATGQNVLCTDQIKQICQLFSFDANKLEYAKFAYRSCADPQNYYIITTIFSFDASKEELMKFIR